MISGQDQDAYVRGSRNARGTEDISEKSRLEKGAVDPPVEVGFRRLRFGEPEWKTEARTPTSTGNSFGVNRCVGGTASYLARSRAVRRGSCCGTGSSSVRSSSLVASWRPRAHLRHGGLCLMCWTLSESDAKAPRDLFDQVSAVTPERRRPARRPN